MTRIDDQRYIYIKALNVLSICPILPLISVRGATFVDKTDNKINGSLITINHASFSVRETPDDILNLISKISPTKNLVIGKDK